MQKYPRAKRTAGIPGCEVRVYPNVVELWQDDERVIAYTPEEWAEMVGFVGITGLVETDDMVFARRA